MNGMSVQERGLEATRGPSSLGGVAVAEKAISSKQSLCDIIGQIRGDLRSSEQTASRTESLAVSVGTVSQTDTALPTVKKNLDAELDAVSHDFQTQSEAMKGSDISLGRASDLKAFFKAIMSVKKEAETIQANDVFKDVETPYKNGDYARSDSPHLEYFSRLEAFCKSGGLFTDGAAQTCKDLWTEAATEFSAEQSKAVPMPPSASSLSRTDSLSPQVVVVEPQSRTESGSEIQSPAQLPMAPRSDEVGVQSGPVKEKISEQDLQTLQGFPSNSETIEATVSKRFEQDKEGLVKFLKAMFQYVSSPETQGNANVGDVGKVAEKFFKSLPIEGMDDVVNSLDASTIRGELEQIASSRLDSLL